MEEENVESKQESELETSSERGQSVDTSLRSLEERVSELEAIVDGMMDYLEEVEVEEEDTTSRTEEEVIVEPSSLPTSSRSVEEETATTVMPSERGVPEKVKTGKDEENSEKPTKQGKRHPTIWG